jgi:hypothetical protein
MALALFNGQKTGALRPCAYAFLSKGGVVIT